MADERETVILVHGLWMGRASMWPLACRLSAAGFATRMHDYATVQSPEHVIARLRARLRRQAGTVHVVGHSLGGLLALLACRDGVDLPPGRIVCLGSPVAGSAPAARLQRQGWTWVMGGSGGLLARGVGAWDGGREVGVISGRARFGPGALLAPLPQPQDGTVAAAETVIAGIHDHCSVRASHGGLLFSRAAAAQAVAFLHIGHFRHGPEFDADVA